MPSSNLCDAIVARNLPLVRQLSLRSQHALNERCPCGRLPLRLALDIPDEEVLKILLNAGASVDALDGDQSVDEHTLLDNEIAGASLHRDTSSLERLLNAGLDVNHVSPGGHTLLTRSIGVSVELVDFILRHGGDPNHRTDSGWTALLYAVDSDNCVFTSTRTKDLVSLLLQFKADATVRLNNGDNVITILSRQQWMDPQAKKEVQTMLQAASYRDPK